MPPCHTNPSVSLPFSAPLVREKDPEILEVLNFNLEWALHFSDSDLKVLVPICELNELLSFLLSLYTQYWEHTLLY